MAAARAAACRCRLAKCSSLVVFQRSGVPTIGVLSLTSSPLDSGPSKRPSGHERSRSAERSPVWGEAIVSKAGRIVFFMGCRGRASEKAQRPAIAAHPAGEPREPASQRATTQRSNCPLPTRSGSVPQPRRFASGAPPALARTARQWSAAVTPLSHTLRQARNTLVTHVAARLSSTRH
jgi:hypothetical protein